MPQFDAIQEFFRPREVKLPGTGMARPRSRSLSDPEMEVDADPRLEYYLTQNFLNDRTEEDMAAALKTGDINDALGLRELFNQGVADVGQSTVARQAPEVAALEKRGKEAMLQGFADPSDPTFVGDGGFAEPIQRQSEAARAMAAFEANKGVREAQIKAQGDVAVENAKGRNQMNNFMQMLEAAGVRPPSGAPMTGAASSLPKGDITQQARAFHAQRQGQPAPGAAPRRQPRPQEVTMGMSTAGPTLSMKTDNTAELQANDMARRMENINTTLDQMVGPDGKMHEGFYGAVGVPSPYDMGSWNRLLTGFLRGEPGKSWAGSSAADFEGFLNTLDSQLGFIEAQKSLKGFGPMSNLELQAARNSINYLRQTQSEDEFMRMIPEVEAMMERLAQTINEETGIEMPVRAPRFNAGGLITDPATGKTYRIKGS